MKLLVDICALRPPLTGIGNYILHLLRILITHPDIEDIVGICGGKIYTKSQLSARILQLSAEQNNSFITTHTLRNYLKKIPGSHWVRPILQNVILGAYWNRYKNYIYWGGNYSLPIWHFSKVVTVHDLSHIHYPECHTKKSVRHLNHVLPKAIKRASAIVAVSYATAKDVTNHFDLKNKQPFIVPPSISRLFHPYQSEQKQQIKEKYQLPEQFILSVGTLEPRKNLTRLLDAYLRLSISQQKQYPLILVGSSGWKSKQLDDKIKYLEKQKSIRWLGYIPTDDLAILYSSARLFVYISLFEGFGMPVLEAMASGTAVITSNCSSMPEVAQQTGAYLVDPEKIDDITRALVTLLENKNAREQLEKQGMLIASESSWDKNTQKLIQVFKDILI